MLSPGAWKDKSCPASKVISLLMLTALNIRRIGARFIDIKSIELVLDTI